MEDIQYYSSLDTLASEIIHDATIIYSDSGNLVAILYAPLLEHYSVKDPYIELKEGVKVDFYDSTKTVSSFLTADYAISYEAQDKMIARKDVVMINNKNEKINTEVLVWDRRKAQIYSNEFVKITTEDKIILGEGFISDERFDNWKIIKPRGDIYINNPDEEKDSLSVND